LQRSELAKYTETRQGSVPNPIIIPSTDFAQMELVAAAVLAPEPKMLEAFKSGEDLHCRTASILLGRTVTKDDKANRSLAKAVNFGLLYGQSAAGLKTYAKNSYGVTMTDEEAVQFREAFFNEYDGLRAWHETSRAAANDPEITEVRTHRIGRQHLADAEHLVAQGSLPWLLRRSRAVARKFRSSP
jgi:DNA polymerase I-like protein with 3'-5' exonuclease and polymerase domains